MGDGGSAVTRLTYVVHSRMPTQKAYGYQVVKMCEAFASRGIDVELWHPRRRRPPEEPVMSVFEFYDLESTFSVRRLWNLDVFRLERRVPRRVFVVLFTIHAICWSLFAALLARRNSIPLAFTREPITAFFLLRMGIRTIFEVHSIPGRGRRWFLQRVISKENPERTIAMTHQLAAALVRLGGSPDEILVLPDAVDPAMFEDLPSREECRLRLDLPLDRTIVGYVGSFEAMGSSKGVEQLVECMGHPLLKAGAERSPLLLCVGGPMNRVPEYLDLARAAGARADALVFRDRVPNRDVPYWIRACDVVTVPLPRTEFASRFTSPMKLFEYMAAGAAIVASDLPALREILEHETNSVLVDPDDPAALAEALNRVLRDAELRAGIGGRARLESARYTWTSRADAIIGSISASDNHVS